MSSRSQLISFFKKNDIIFRDKVLYKRCKGSSCWKMYYRFSLYRNKAKLMQVEEDTIYKVHDKKILTGILTDEKKMNIIIKYSDKILNTLIES